MCKVAPFSREQVKAFRFTIDFCYWRGIPIARKWPEWKYPAASQKQLEFQEAMRISRAFLKEINPTVRLFWHNIFQGKKPSWIDRYTSTFFDAYKLLAPAWPPFLKRIQFNHNSPDLTVTFEASQPGDYYVVALPKAVIQETAWKRQKGTWQDDCHDRYPFPVATSAAYVVPPTEILYPTLISTQRDIRQSNAFGDSLLESINTAWADLLADDWVDVPWRWPQLISTSINWGYNWQTYIDEVRDNIIIDWSDYPEDKVQQVTQLGMMYYPGGVWNGIFAGLPPNQIAIDGEVQGSFPIYPYSSPAFGQILSGDLSYPQSQLTIGTNPALYGFTYPSGYVHGWELRYQSIVGGIQRKLYKAEFLQASVTDSLDDLFYLVYEGTHRLPISLPVPYNTETTV
jgi:hypothetical protein